jgi:SAM-dependent methyltransferase
MKESLLEILACPISRQPLTLLGAERKEGEITGGLLTAEGRKYPIIDGVPCFLDADQQIAAKKGFTPMWRYRQQGAFEHRTVYGIKPARKAEWVEHKFPSPILAGDRVLDAGCGSAETTRALADRHPDAQVVGLDFSDAVRVAAHASELMPNLHFVQADIANPPFRAGTFNKVLSLGVLHHTPDTRTALDGAGKLLAADGELLLWLYPAFGESLMTDQLYLMRDLHFMGAAHKLQPEIRLKAAKLYSLGMMPSMMAAYGVYKTLSKLGGHKSDKVLSEDMSVKELFDTATFAVYDNLTPQYQHRHSKKEVMGWLHELGMTGLCTDGHGTFTARVAEMPAKTQIA